MELKMTKMSLDSFNNLLSSVNENLMKQDTVMRDCIGVEEKLAITLRYLGTGCSFRSLHFEYLIGRATAADLVKDTCEVLWDTLNPEFMKPKAREDWICTSEKFGARANFPHCVGAIDGKHVRIT
ncbi:uncharacterized protein [Periplaneta americana]|uniref:uncharacterized protein n=1 Tax=Periplaneta americana TaxID=6978 RepID=UPI0037E8175B